MAARRGLATHLLAVVAAAALLPSCSRDVPAPPASAVNAAATAPRRVVSLAPSITETLVALDLSDRLVGISDYCPAVTAKPSPVRVGGLNNLNLEAILALRPDLVMTVQRADDRTLATLTDHGVAVFANDPETLEQLLASIEAIGDRFGRGDAARALVTRLRERLARVAVAAARQPRRPTLYVEVDAQGPWTVGRRSFVRDAVVAAGADNLFDDVANGYPTVSAEAVAARDPDWVLILHPPDRPLEQRGGLAHLRAVRDHHVIDDFDRDALLHSSPRIVDGIEALAARLGVVPAAAPADGGK